MTINLSISPWLADPVALLTLISAYEKAHDEEIIGASGQFLGLEHLVQEKAIGPEDFLLIVAAGAGFSYSAAVLEVLEVPSW